MVLTTSMVAAVLAAGGLDPTVVVGGRVDALLAELLTGIEPRKDRMLAALAEGYATATDLADYLVKKGLPFRDAHEAVARAVRACDDAKCDLSEMTLEKLREFSPLVGEDVFAVLTLEGSVAARDHVGGTAPRQVREAIARVRKQLAN